MKISINLPWPESELWPNRKAHWRVRGPIAAAARSDACLLVYGDRGVWHDGNISVHYLVRPPSRRKFDSDGIESALKPYRDGVCDGLGIDDARLWPVVKELGPTVKGGQIVMTLEQK